MNEAVFLKQYDYSPEKFSELKEKFRNKEIHLSYSKLKNLTSPLDFTINLISPKKSNAGMSFGTLVDAYLTDRAKFNREYQVKEIKISEGNQTEVVNRILSGDKNIPIQDRFQTAFKEVYSKGKIENYGHLLEYCMGVEMGITYITQAEMNKVEVVVESLMNSDEASFILSTAEEFQKKIEFEYRGWKFLCYLDILEATGFTDLKFESNLNPDKFYFSIQKYGYDIQQAVYRRAVESIHNDATVVGKFIAYDDKGNNSVMIFGEDYMRYALKKLDVYINRLEKMIKEDVWFASYDFFNPNIKTIYKPKFIEGFSEDDLQPE